MNKFVIKITKTLRAHSSKRHGIAKMQGEKQIKIKSTVRRNN